jgi:hypothetical protein
MSQPIEAIPILRVADVDASVVWHERLGIVKESEHRFEDGMPAFVSITRREAHSFLSEPPG